MLLVKVIDQLRIMKSLSVRELARISEVNQAHLSGWFKGISGRLSSEKIEKVLLTLGLDRNGIPLPGIQRYTVPSMSTTDMEKAEWALRTLLPGGFLIITLRPDGVLDGITRYDYALIPNLYPGVRVILSLKTFNLKDIIVSSRGLRLGGLGAGSRWYGGSVSDKRPTDSFISLQSSVVERIVNDENMSISSLEEILGLSSTGKDWTWEMLNAGLEAKGITPQEAAKALGLL